MPKASIIIVSYNALHETTAPCLESIFANTDYADFEVIAVDNNSSDGTPDYLARFAAREPRLRYIHNKSNRGFPGGNNDGIGTANGDFLVLLNSDTLVSRGWLTKLTAAVENDLTIGLVGPVSNAVGNEQKIFTCGLTTAEILAEGLSWTETSQGDAFETELLGFFCVAMRRDVIEHVGLLDEAYDLGFYEDDDFCLRVRKAGYRLVCLEDVFVYHQGSASFSKVSTSTRELLKRNKKQLERKFGPTYRPRHPRDRQLDLIESYLERIKSFGFNDALAQKTMNRLRLVEELRPRGFLKRIRFDKRSHLLRSSFMRHGRKLETIP